MKFIFTLFVLLCTCCPNYAQSIVQEQKAFYDRYHFTEEKDWDQLQEQLTKRKFKTLPSGAFAKTSACTLGGRRVFGWHPYWNGANLQNNYQWNLLSDLCYFDYTIDPASGANANVSFAWSSSTAVTMAKEKGLRISFCTTLFSAHATFLSSQTAKNNFIQKVIDLLKARGGNGVCIDFEGMPASQKTNFSSFIQTLSQKIHEAIPGAEVSICLPAVDWNGVFDVATLRNYADLFIIMGYDYYYGGSSTAGPVGPLYPYETAFPYSMSRSVSAYLWQGLSPQQLLLGVPYYGRQYQTASSALPAANSGGSAASTTPLYKSVRDNLSGDYSNANKYWDNNSFTPCFIFQKNAKWYQCFIEDSLSLQKRYAIVNQCGLAGIGIWTLGYDDGYTELWDAIRKKLSSCADLPCSDTLYDMGGPNRNYQDKESYVTTIKTAEATRLSLQFSQFDLEAAYDSLSLYDGPNTASPLIGKYSGTNTPGTVLSTSNSLTLSFRSDGATNRPGYKAVYTCMPIDTTAPTTALSLPAWISTDFTARFSDSDQGSGIAQRFYGVACRAPGGNWSANWSNGFLFDAFDGTTWNPDWIRQSGSWTLSANALSQSDQLNANSNVYTPFTQNSDQLLYHWKQRINGNGSNRRAGMHFMCSASDGSGRGTSYLVYARADGGGRLQIYKYVNDVMYLNADLPFPFMANVYYDLKVMYLRNSGKIRVFVNDKLAAEWTDPAPLMSGNYICFRSGECVMNIDEVEVMKGRSSDSALITAGINSASDLIYANADSLHAAARITSLVVDAADLFSAEAVREVNVDFSPPTGISLVRDGLGKIDGAATSSRSQLSANWTTASDPQSGISAYCYAIGTRPGATDVVDWRSNGAGTSVSHSGLILQVGTIYYFSVKAVNTAGLSGAATSSNGQLVIPFNQGSEVSRYAALDAEKDTLPQEETIQDAVSFRVHPNPANAYLDIEYTLNNTALVSLLLIDRNGRMLSCLADKEWQLSGDHAYHYLPKGLNRHENYLLILRVNDAFRSVKWIWE